MTEYQKLINELKETNKEYCAICKEMTNAKDIESFNIAYNEVMSKLIQRKKIIRKIKKELKEEILTF
jgi:superfamily II RNA helicase